MKRLVYYNRQNGLEEGKDPDAEEEDVYFELRLQC